MSEQTNKGPIAWMARNPVASNLLMLFLIIGGFITASSIRQEIFPEFEVDIIVISVPYPGTSPEEVEQGIILAVEESVRDIDGIKRINSTAAEGRSSVIIELLSSANSSKVLQDVKNAIDRITTLPEEAERPIVQLPTIQNSVITVILYGDANLLALRSLAEKCRTELLQSPKITEVEVEGFPPLEISIEIPQETLRKYNLTLSEVAAKIRMASKDYSGGGVKTSGGEILLRLNERRDLGKEYREVPIVSMPDGTEVLLKDMAIVKDGFADTDETAYFDGKPGLMIKVNRVGDQTPMEVSAAVKDYIKKLKPDLPKGIGVATLDDRAESYQDRLDLLIRNAVIGLVLVLVLLGMFLNIKLAFWVTMGIPISFLGGILFLPYFDVSINMISLFAFIMALGIVVDDAIVVGENVFTMRNQGKPYLEAAIIGAKQMAVPVTFAILTNIAAFLPLAFVEGVMGKVFRQIPIVVCLAFIISLLEALVILPAHLGHSKKVTSEKGFFGRIGQVQGKISKGLEWLIETYYKPLLLASLKYRYLTIAIGFSILFIVFGYLKSGRMPMTYFPNAEADVVTVGLELPYGSPVEDTIRIQKDLVDKAREVLKKYGGDKMCRGIFSRIGMSSRPGSRMSPVTGSHAAYIGVYLIPIKERTFTGEEFASKWREAMGEIPGIESIFFQAVQLGPPGGSALDIQLSHDNPEVLEAAAVELAGYYKNYSAVRDIDDGFTPGKPQLDFHARPEAYSLGLTPAEIGRQVRDRFYGAEALRLQRGRDEVKVMVRLPENERKSELSVEEMLIKTPMGGELPLREAAELERGRAYTRITRTDAQRTINVTADVIPAKEAGTILNSLVEGTLPKLLKKYPGLTYSFSGRQRSQGESMVTLRRNFILAMIAIFFMLGVVFKSYIQPIIIMVSIPFGIVGAVIGHLIMGFNLSIVTMFGLTALSGVVLNDALVLIDFANIRRLEGATSFEAISEAGVRRFRPIMLTTLTTFGGLAPMIFEKSFQARILIPMAISLGYGIVFGTAIILVLVPSFYLIVEDIKRLFGMEEASNNVLENTGDSRDKSNVP